MDSLRTPASSNRGVPVARKLFTESGVYGSPVSNDPQALWSYGSGSGKFGHTCGGCTFDSDSASSDLEEEVERESRASSEEGDKVLPEPTHIKPGETYKPLRGAVVTLPLTCASGAGMEGVARTLEDDLHQSGSSRPAPALASVFPPQTSAKQSSNVLSNPLYDRPQPQPQPQPQAMSAKSLFKSKLQTTAPTAPLQIKRADLRLIVSPELQMDERRELLDRDGELCHPIASQGWKVYPGIVAGRAANEVSCGIPTRQPLCGAQESPEPAMPVYLNQESSEPSSPEPRVSSRYLTQETPEPLSLGTLSPRNCEPRVSSRYLTQETPEPLSLEPLSPRNDVMNSSSPVHEGEPDGSSTEAGTGNKKSELSESSTGKENQMESESFAFDNRFNRMARPGLMTGSGGLFHVGRSMHADAPAEASRQHNGDAERHRRPLRINTGAISHALNQHWPKDLHNVRSQGQTDGKALSRIPKASNLPHPDGTCVDADFAISAQQPLQATLGAAGVVVSRIPRRPLNSGPVLSRKVRPMESRIPQCADGHEASRSGDQEIAKDESLDRLGSPRSEDSQESASNSVDSDDTCATPDSVIGMSLDQSLQDAGSEGYEAVVADVAGKNRGKQKRPTKWGSALDNEYSVELKINVPRLLEYLLLLSLLLLGGVFAFRASRIVGGMVPQSSGSMDAFLSKATTEHILSLPSLPGSILSCASSRARDAVSSMFKSLRKAVKVILHDPDVVRSPVNAHRPEDSLEPKLGTTSPSKQRMAMEMAEQTKKVFTTLWSSLWVHTGGFAHRTVDWAIRRSWRHPPDAGSTNKPEAAKDKERASRTAINTEAPQQAGNASLAEAVPSNELETPKRAEPLPPPETGPPARTEDHKDLNVRAKEPKDKEPSSKVVIKPLPVSVSNVKELPPSASNDSRSYMGVSNPKVTPPPTETRDSKAREPVVFVPAQGAPHEAGTVDAPVLNTPKVSKSRVNMGDWSSKEKSVHMQFRYEPTLVEIINWNIERLCFVMFTMAALYFVFTGERVDFGGAELSCGYQPRRLF